MTVFLRSAAFLGLVGALVGLPAAAWADEPAAEPEVAKQTAPEQAVTEQAVTAPLVRFSGATTLGAALVVLERASGLGFNQPLPADTPLTLPQDEMPFWPALDQVLDQAELDIDFYGGDAQSLRLRPRRGGRPGRVDSASYAGIYRLEPTIVTSRRVLRQNDLSGLSVEVELAWVPGIWPIGVTLPLDQLAAELDDAQVIRGGSEGGSLDIAINRGVPMARLHLPLRLPGGAPTEITALRGQIRSMLPGKAHRFEFPLHTVSVTQTNGAVTVQLEDVRRNGDIHEVRLGVDFRSPGAAMESHRRFLLDNEIFVVRGDGTRAEQLGYQLHRQSETGIGIAYIFDLGLAVDEATLVYETPTAIVQEEIEFTLPNIPLP